MKLHGTTKFIVVTHVQSERITKESQRTNQLLTVLNVEDHLRRQLEVIVVALSAVIKGN